MVQYTPILKTKLYCPKSTNGLIVRDRLHRQLDLSSQYPLTLISAPPGYGKTVLASSWAREQLAPIAWLILDREESNLEQFLAYLIAALDNVSKDAFSATKAVLATAELPAISHITQLLANDIDAMDDELFLILDDYHLVDHGSVVHELIGLLLHCPPPNLHLVILTRRDPPLPLKRLRANNQCLELRLAELRFRIDETSALLQAALTPALSPTAIANVQDVLEGWGAGIRMVTLAARNALAGDEYLQRLSGHLQQVQEYMFDEVIKGLPRPTLHYLLCSALPQRFSAPLLDAMVVAKPAMSAGIDGQAFVDFAEHRNMFTTALDARAEWFRYHNLFRELLLQRVYRTYSAEALQAIVSEAAAWFEAAGEIDDAIRILVEHDYVGEALEIVDRHRDAALDADHWLGLQSWLQKFSPAQVEFSPVLLLTKASLAAFNLDVYQLRELVQQLDTHQSAGGLSETQCAELEFFRALPLFWNGDIAAARTCLEQAARFPPAYGQVAGELYIYLSMSVAMTGEHDLALQVLHRADALNAGKHNIFLTRLLAAKSLVLYIALQPAKSLIEAEHIITLAAEEVPSEHARGWGHYMRTLALLNSGRIDTARRAVEEALRESDHLEKRVQIELYLALGICHSLQVNVAGVAAAIGELKTLKAAAPSSALSTLAQSALVRLTLLQGESGAAQQQALELPQTPTAGTLAFWLEEPCVTWAKVQLMSGNETLPQRVIPLLDALDRQVSAQHLKPWQVEIRIMQAIAESRVEHLNAAQHLLQSAIKLARPRHWVGPFAELARGLSPPLLEGLTKDEFAFVHEAVANRGQLWSAPAPVSCEICPDQFTNRELDILELLANRRRNKEIATTLFISANTVNYHLKHIYQKLEVTGRRQAVVRATALGILSSSVSAK